VTTIPGSVRAVIESGRLGHLVTLNADGSPQVTCVWVSIQAHSEANAPIRPVPHNDAGRTRCRAPAYPALRKQARHGKRHLDVDTQPGR
jgi:hypothetical protein